MSFCTWRPPTPPGQWREGGRQREFDVHVSSMWRRDTCRQVSSYITLKLFLGFSHSFLRFVAFLFFLPEKKDRRRPYVAVRPAYQGPSRGCEPPPLPPFRTSSRVRVGRPYHGTRMQNFSQVLCGEHSAHTAFCCWIKACSPHPARCADWHLGPCLAPAPCTPEANS